MSEGKGSVVKSGARRQPQFIITRDQSRLFLAIPVAGEARSFMADLKRMGHAWTNDGPLALPIRRLTLVDGRNVHVTLSFLGNVDNVLIPAMKADFAKIEMPDFQLSFLSSWIFVTGPREVVAALTLAATPPLLNLKKAVDEVAARHVPVDKRPYKPHITLARIRFKESVRTREGREQVELLRDSLQQLPMMKAPAFGAGRFAFCRSVNENGRMRHEELVSVSLKP